MGMEPQRGMAPNINGMGMLGTSISCKTKAGKFLKLILTSVPPLVGPSVGLTDVMLGSGILLISTQYA